MNSTTGAALFALSSSGTLVYRARVVTFAQRQMVWVNRSGSEEVISEDRRAYLQPRISPDGKRLAIAIGEVAADRDVWLYDLVRRTMTRLTFDVGEDETPVWSPDGTRIAISGARQGQPRTIFTVPATGSSQATQIATTKYITHLGDWRAGGGALAWTDYDPAQGGDIRLLSMSGGPPRVRDFIVGGFNERSPAFSSDGRWVAYTSTETGQSAVFVQAVDDPSGKFPISPEGGSQPIWSPNGKELYYRGPTHMMAVPFTTTSGFSAGTPVPLFPDKYRPRASGQSELRRGARRPLPDAQVPGASRPAAAPRGSELVPGTSGPRFLMKDRPGLQTRPGASAQFLNGDVLVPGLRLPATMDLQADQAVSRNLRVGLGIVDCLTAVDRERIRGPSARIS